MLILQSIFNVIKRGENDHAVLYGPSFLKLSKRWDGIQVRTKIIKGCTESGESVKIKLFCSDAVASMEIKFKWLHFLLFVDFLWQVLARMSTTTATGSKICRDVNGQS